MSVLSEHASEAARPIAMHPDLVKKNVDLRFLVHICVICSVAERNLLWFCSMVTIATPARVSEFCLSPFCYFENRMWKRSSLFIWSCVFKEQNPASSPVQLCEVFVAPKVPLQVQDLLRVRCLASVWSMNITFQFQIFATGGRNTQWLNTWVKVLSW